MRRCPVFLRWLCVLLTVALVWLQGERVATQQSLPWTGIATDEARSVDTGAVGAASVRSHALSGDGRYIAFTANYPLISSDTNGTSDIYVRDRATGLVELISMGFDGSPADGDSDPAAISEDGRHVAFLSTSSNLVTDDTNGNQDVFVHDRLTHTTSLVSIGVAGETTGYGLYEGISLSADGRFVTFMAIFGAPGSPWSLYLRDRDPDMNGVFDEPDLATTSAVAPSEVGDWTVYTPTDAVISPDGRYLAFAATADQGGLYSTYGTHVFLIDRETSEAVIVDAALFDDGEVQADARGLALSNGYLSYVSNVNYLVEDDTDSSDDVFVYDIAAATNSIVRIDVQDPPEMSFKSSTGISADGRYVIFGGYRFESFGIAGYGFAVDRETSQTHEIGLRPDGSRTEIVHSVALSADGSAIAFWGVSEVLVKPDFNSGVYVETAVSMSPSILDTPQDGGTFAVELSAPDSSWWSVDHPDYVTVSPESGVGSATLSVTIDPNVTGQTRTTVVAVGSEAATFRQVQQMFVTDVQPSTGSFAGGELVTLVGSGFTSDLVVTFGGVAATNIIVVSSNTLQVQSPAHAVGLVDVVVSDAASSFTVANGFRYVDNTPPQITMMVNGAPSVEDWYVGPVTVVWAVEDPESNVTIIDGCGTALYSADSTGEQAWCTAASEGGTDTVSFHVRIDATPPTIAISAPQQQSYALNQQVTLAYSCDDVTSGLNFCVASQAGPRLNTSTLGSFTFSVNAEDGAGNVASKIVPYAVKLPTFLAVPPTSATYGGTASLRTTLTGNGSPLANRTVVFLVDNVQVGSAVTNASGLATLSVNIAGKNAGNHPVRTLFTEDQTALAATGNGTLIINKAATTITWNTPSPITYGTPLSDTQLNATANVPGTFVYAPQSGTVLIAGTHSLLATFTPTDSANYLSSSRSVSIVVNKAPVSITWQAPLAITYGTVLSGSQLNASTNIAGSFVYSPSSGTALPAGAHQLSVTFTPIDTANYLSGSSGVTLTVNKATPELLWPGLAPITYGTALSEAQLSATANVPGTLAFTPVAGTILPAGTHEVLATFTPSDTGNYQVTSASQLLVVTQAPLLLQANDAIKVYGEALPSFSVSATGLVNGDTVATLGGAPSFLTSATSSSAPGTYAVTPHGVTSPNYAIAFASGALTITKANTVLTLNLTPNPSRPNRDVTLQAVVSAGAPGAGAATGVVEFRENGVLIGTAPLVNGEATVIRSFKRGSHPLTATFLGDTNFNGSVGANTLATN